MVRLNQPQLKLKEDIENIPMKERASLALFRGLLHEHPRVMQLVLGDFSRASDVVERARKLDKEDVSDVDNIVRVTAGVFVSGIDTKYETDELTRQAASSAIKEAREAAKVNGEQFDRDHMRMLHVQTFVGEVATWSELQGLPGTVWDFHEVGAIPPLRVLSGGLSMRPEGPPPNDGLPLTYQNVA